MCHTCSSISPWPYADSPRGFWYMYWRSWAKNERGCAWILALVAKNIDVQTFSGLSPNPCLENRLFHNQDKLSPSRYIWMASRWYPVPLTSAQASASMQTWPKLCTVSKKPLCHVPTSILADCQWLQSQHQYPSFCITVAKASQRSKLYQIDFQIRNIQSKRCADLVATGVLIAMRRFSKIKSEITNKQSRADALLMHTSKSRNPVPPCMTHIWC